MLSRVAENLYWLGRYLERADNVARMADVDHQSSLEGVTNDTEQIWTGLINATASDEAFAAARAADPEVSAPEFLLLSPLNPGSLRSTLAEARSLARGLREHISREVWQEINALHLGLGQQTGVSGPEIYDLCDRLERGIQAILGHYDNAAFRDEGREWFRCGLYLERADMTSRIIDTKYHVLLPSADEVGGPFDRFQWMAILRSASAWEAYRKTGHQEITGPAVADLLMFNRAFPRSLTFSVMAMLRHYQQATERTPKNAQLPPERLLTLLNLDMSGLDVESVVEDGLHEFLDGFQVRLGEVNRTITETIFKAAPMPGGVARGSL